MPQNEIHGIFTLKKYGVTGNDIHKWMDEPSSTHGIWHRFYRHDYWMWIPLEFVDRYGLELARAIIRSHIWLDENWYWLKNKNY